MSSIEQTEPSTGGSGEGGALDVPYLRTGEVAVLFGVSERSVRQWADAGRLPCIRTSGGHRLFHTEAVLTALEKASGGRAAVRILDLVRQRDTIDLTAPETSEIATPPHS